METLFVGKNIIFLPETESTNSYATGMLKNVNLPEGTVIDTAHQTRGKGQRGSTWNAQALGNLTCSIVIKPEFLELKNQFFLYQIAALACYDTTAEMLNNSQFDIKIKWPNDILVNEKKICGILIENNIVSGKLNWCVIGVGLNVNQGVFNELQSATSLHIQAGHNYEVKMVREVLCKHFEKYYLALRSGKIESIKKSYLTHFFGLNAYREFEIRQDRVTLLVKGISEKGLLLLESRTGEQIEVDVKEVKWLY